MSISRSDLPKFKLFYTDSQSAKKIKPTLTQLYLYEQGDGRDKELVVKYYDITEKSVQTQSLLFDEVKASLDKNGQYKDGNSSHQSSLHTLCNIVGNEKIAASKIAYLFTLNIIDYSTRKKTIISTLDLLTKQFNHGLLNYEELCKKTTHDIARDSRLQHVTIEFNNVRLWDFTNEMASVKANLNHALPVIQDYILCFFNQGGFSVLSQTTLQKRALGMGVSCGSAYNAKDNEIKQQLIINHDGSVTFIETITLHCVNQSCWRGDAHIQSDTPLAMMQTVTAIQYDGKNIKHQLISDHCIVLDTRVKKLFSSNASLMKMNRVSNEKMSDPKKQCLVFHEQSEPKRTPVMENDNDLIIDETEIGNYRCDYADHEVLWCIGDYEKVKTALENNITFYKETKCNPVELHLHSIFKVCFDVISSAGLVSAPIVNVFLDHIFNNEAKKISYKQSKELFYHRQSMYSKNIKDEVCLELNGELEAKQYGFCL